MRRGLRGTRTATAVGARPERAEAGGSPSDDERLMMRWRRSRSRWTRTTSLKSLMVLEHLELQVLEHLEEVGALGVQFVAELVAESPGLLH